MVALSSQSRMRELGNAARRRVELEFSEQVMIDAHLKLYEGWLVDLAARIRSRNQSELEGEKLLGGSLALS